MKFWFSKYRQQLTPEEKKERRNDRYLLILSGIMLGFGFPPFPFPFPILLFFGLVPYFYVIEKRKTLAEINKATYLAFLFFNIITLYWVGSWQKAADPFLMISGGVLVFFNPVLFLIPSTLYYIFKKTFSSKYALFVLPIFWITYEYLYMITQLSFPWLTLGNGMAKFNIFIQIADIVGAVGISLIVLYINVFLYKAVISLRASKQKFYYNLATALIIFILVFSYGIYKINSFHITKRTIDVGIIQPNLDPWEKWSGGDLNNLTNEYLNLSKKAVDAGAKLIIWPETALPVFLLDGSYNKTVNKIYKFLQENNVFLVTGMPDVKYYFNSKKIPKDAIKVKNENYYYTMYNGVLLFAPDSRRVQHYGKMKLVPFGERVPYVDEFPFLGNLLKWGVGISGWNIGKDTTNFELPLREGSNYEQQNTKSDSIKINVLVCYESVFPYFVVDFVQRGAKVITIVTNDSWYGKSSGPYQHEDIAVLRAVENRRAVVQVANGGVSCIINPLGKTKTESKLFTKTVLTGKVELESRETFFTKYPLIIPVIASVISFWVFAIFLMKKIKVKLKA